MTDTANQRIRKREFGFDTVALPSGKRFIDCLQLHSLLANLECVDSLVIHPTSTTRSLLSVDQQKSTGVTPGYVQLSVELESIDDILYDLDHALNGV